MCIFYEYPPEITICFTVVHKFKLFSCKNKHVVSDMQKIGIKVV